MQRRILIRLSPIDVAANCSDFGFHADQDAAQIAFFAQVRKSQSDRPIPHIRLTSVNVALVRVAYPAAQGKVTAQGEGARDTVGVHTDRSAKGAVGEVATCRSTKGSAETR